MKKNKMCLNCNILIGNYPQKRCEKCQQNHIKNYRYNYRKLNPPIKERVAEYWKRYAGKHKEELLIRSKEYRINNLETCRKRGRGCEAKRRKRILFGGLWHKVVGRDNFFCNDCKKDVSKKRMMHIHHIDRNPKNNTLNNLATLCASCHMKRHQRAGHLKRFFILLN